MLLVNIFLFTSETICPEQQSILLPLLALNLPCTSDEMSAYYRLTSRAVPSVARLALLVV